MTWQVSRISQGSSSSSTGCRRRQQQQQQQQQQRQHRSGLRVPRQPASFSSTLTAEPSS
jgi:hypothetical protein